MNAHQFLEALYPEIPDNAYFLLWKDKKSHWFTDIIAAADHIASNPDDIYYGVGLSPENYGKHKRCKAHQIKAIPGLFAEIDVGKPGAPPTQEDALSLLQDNGVNPTLIVGSGGGFHSYWLFKELLIFSNNDEREAAAHMNRRLCQFLRDKAAAKGWTVDGVFDLSRVLRPIGSNNCKKSVKVPVTIINNNGPRYQDPDNFDEFLPELEHHAQVSVEEIQTVKKTLVVNTMAEAPTDMIMALVENEPDFKNLWDKKPKSGDKSASAYDFQLCKIAIEGKATDQDCTNLMIAFARKHALEIKTPNYFARTVVAARKSVEGEAASDAIETANLLSGTVYESPAAKQEALDALCKPLKVGLIERIERYVGDDLNYRFITDRGVVKIQSTQELLTQYRFQARWAEQAKVVIPKVSQAKWEKTVQTIINCCDDNVADPEASADTRIVIWIRGYLLDCKDILTFDEWERQHESRQHHPKPFVSSRFENKNCWFIKNRSLRRWAYAHREYLGDVNQLAKEMRPVGCKSKQFNNIKVLDQFGKKLERRTTGNFWMIPHEIAHPEKMHELLL